MARVFNPGDLIRAEDFTEIFATLEAYENRISALEAGATGIIISQVNPVGEQKVGQMVEVYGANLPAPAESLVTFGSSEALFFGISSSRIMRVRVPEVVGVPKNLEIRIESQLTGEIATWPFRVLAEDPSAPVPQNITSALGNDLRQGSSFTLSGSNLGPNPRVRFTPDAGGTPVDVATPATNPPDFNEITGTVPDLGIALLSSGNFQVSVKVGDNEQSVPRSVKVINLPGN